MSYTAVGKRLPRLEGAAKVTGETIFTADVKLTGMVYVKVLRSPYAHAIIKKLDTNRAKAYPGVVGVFTAQDLPGHLPRDSANRLFTVMAQREVLYYGQPVAAVVAEEAAIAEEALGLIEAEYEELPLVMDILDALREDAPAVRSTMAGVDRSELAAHTTAANAGSEEDGHNSKNITQRMVFSRGDVEKGLAEADVIVEQVYRVPWVHQGYIEPFSALVDCSAAGEYTVWTSTQGNFTTREGLAKLLGIHETKIKVEPVEMGGGFGAKIQPLAATLPAALAKIVRRPVKLVLSRSEDMRSAVPAPQAYIELKTGAKKDGTLTALKAKIVYDSGAFPGSPLMAGANFLGGYYKFPNLEIVGLEVITNRVSQGALRAPGVPQATFAIESQMDIMAKELGLDPLSFRMQNAVAEGDPMPNGRTYPRVGLKECLQRMAETNLWKNRHQKGPNQGIGIAIGGWLGGLQPASAAAVFNSDGTFTVLVGSADITGTNTSFNQIAAEVLGLPLDQIQVKTGNTSSAPYAGVSAGSKTLRTVGYAVEMAARDVLGQLSRIAAERLECSPDDLEAADGGIRVKGSPEKALTYQILATMTTGFGSMYPLVMGKGNVGSPAMAPGFTVQGVKVEVDPDTGEVTILDSVIIQDVGFAINPMSVEGQMQGGISQALGIGYSEEMLWNEKGVLLNPGLLDYRLPTALDLPKIQALIVEVPTKEGPFGARGVGEPPITAGAAALANAVAEATGARVFQAPVTPERIVRAMGKIE